MKKVFFIALLVLILPACTTKEFYEVTEVVVPNTFTQIYEIYAEDMVKEIDRAGNPYYEYEFVETALTRTVFDTGILQAFLYYKKDGVDTMSPLPISDFMLENGYQWEEQFTIEFQVGKIKFIQKISDHTDDFPAFISYTILVRFLW
jgi:hypothetical protein